MCGLAGILTYSPVTLKQINMMTDVLSHRGPDDSGAWVDSESGIGLGHRRLSVVDLSAAGHQPMHSHSGRYVLVFNGEIYNHLELRTTLGLTKTIEWKGHSDTETLLECFEEWGLEKTLIKCVGMFAFALWDRQSLKLSLGRDRFGEKPLYYGWIGDSIVFGSEIKAIREAPGFDSNINDDAVSLFFRHKYVPAPWSILERIYKIEPGQFAILDRSHISSAPTKSLSLPAIDFVKYWSLESTIVDGSECTFDERDGFEQLEGVLVEAIRLQNVADVRVGAFLSGGIDSSLIVALMRDKLGVEVNTFTIGFAETGFDEAPSAKAIAKHLNTNHTELYVSPNDVISIIPDIAKIYDEPFGDSSQLPTYLVSKMARNSVTVALTGDGADELFGGYNAYIASRKVWNFASSVPAWLRNSIGVVIESVPASFLNEMQRLPVLSKLSMFDEKFRKLGRLLRSDCGPLDIYRSGSEEWLNATPTKATARTTLFDNIQYLQLSTEEQMMYFDLMSYLPNDILTKVDRAAMAVGLETRAPFLDHRVVQQAWRIPIEYKIKNGKNKWILRQLLNRYVPEELMDRPKSGFSIPLGQWLRGPLRGWAEDLLSAESSALDGRLN